MTQVNDCKLAFYQANGATSNAIQDAEREYLIAVLSVSQAIVPMSNQDMWLKLLGDGAYPDVRDAFWLARGCTGADRTLGAELVTNGGFDSDTDWLKSGGWTVGNGTGNSDGVAGDLFQGVSTTQNTDYWLTVDVSGTFQGAGLTVTLGDGDLFAVTDGAKSTIINTGGSSGAIFFKCVNTNEFIGSIDNVSLKEIL